MAAALAGGVFDIGDRVAAISGSGSPAFGSRGTVVGTYDDAVEVGLAATRACRSPAASSCFTRLRACRPRFMPCALVLGSRALHATLRL